jgi:hypothetical protein
MAHELNNPAGAVKRGVEQLLTAFARHLEAHLALDEAALSIAQVDQLRQLAHRAKERAAHPLDLDTLTRSDHESELES